MRLLDRLLGDRFDPGYADEQKIRELLAEAQLVAVDNVWEYWTKYRHHDLPTSADFPNVMLPFDLTFMEMKIAHSSDPNDIGNTAEAAGLLLCMGDKTAPTTEEMANSWLYGPTVKYHMLGYYFLKSRGDKSKLVSRIGIPIDQTGCIVPNPEPACCDYSIQPLREIGLPGKSQVQAHSEAVVLALYPSLLALSFMHCRNVKVVKEGPPLPLSRKHEKRTGRPLIRYHLLQIDHMKEILEREGHASVDGLKKALSICRGHFKRYGIDGRDLLFGKYRALVWRPMELRGSLEQGIVAKDYTVK